MPAIVLVMMSLIHKDESAVLASSKAVVFRCVGQYVIYVLNTQSPKVGQTNVFGHIHCGFAGDEQPLRANYQLKMFVCSRPVRVNYLGFFLNSLFSAAIGISVYLWNFTAISHPLFPKVFLLHSALLVLYSYHMTLRC